VLTVDADRVENLEAAIDAVGEDDTPLRARLLATLGLELTWQPDHRRRVALSDEALRIARSLDDPETLAEEFYSFNTLGAWVGDGTPAFMLAEGRDGA
jgi:hypothetical protein